MPKSLVFEIDYKIIKELCCHRIGEYVTIKFFREVIYMPDYCIVDGCIVFRLASASLFKNVPDEVGEEYSFEGLLLTEVVNVVLSRCAGRDRL